MAAKSTEAALQEVIDREEICSRIEEAGRRNGGLQARERLPDLLIGSGVTDSRGPESGALYD